MVKLQLGKYMSNMKGCNSIVGLRKNLSPDRININIKLVLTYVLTASYMNVTKLQTHHINSKVKR